MLWRSGIFSLTSPKHRPTHLCWCLSASLKSIVGNFMTFWAAGKGICLHLQFLKKKPFFPPLILKSFPFPPPIRLFAREDQQKVVHIAGLHEVRVESVGSLLEVCSLFQPHKTLRYCFPARKIYNSQFNLTNQPSESFFSSLLLYSLTKVISHGMAERTQGTSGVNAHSSRSHAMLQIQLRGQNQQMAGR